MNIYDITGKEMKSSILKKGSNAFDLSELSKGIYIVRVDEISYQIIKE